MGLFSLKTTRYFLVVLETLEAEIYIRLLNNLQLMLHTVAVRQRTGNSISNFPSREITCMCALEDSIYFMFDRI